MERSSGSGGRSTRPCISSSGRSTGGGGSTRCAGRAGRQCRRPFGPAPGLLPSSDCRLSPGEQIAKEVIKSFFPDARIVDYEAITESLPSDYSIDGEHWGCRTDIWMARAAGRPARCEDLRCLSLSSVSKFTLREPLSDV